MAGGFMMKVKDGQCRVAVVQAEPVMFDKKACLSKALSLLKKAAKGGANLVVFPELFIPGYPYGMNFGFSVGRRTADGRKDWKRYSDASIVVGEEETEVLKEEARKLGVYVSIGISERDAVNGTLYNSNLLISPDGEVLTHRKLKPTGSERVLWGDANEGYFPVMDTPWGPIGCLICWESYMPLARTALYQKGITIYISCNTNDNAEWQHTIRHIALEGRCFVINCDMLITKDSYPGDLATAPEKDAVSEGIVCRGGSCVIDPYGHDISETVWDMERIIYADLDMEDAAAAKMEFDPCGHYARNDVLSLHVDDK